jgi:hypothetical protein
MDAAEKFSLVFDVSTIKEYVNAHQKEFQEFLEKRGAVQDEKT